MRGLVIFSVVFVSAVLLIFPGKLSISEQPILEIQARALAALESKLPAPGKPTYRHLSTFRIDRGAVTCGEVAYASGLGWDTQFTRFIASENSEVVLLEKMASTQNPLEEGNIFKAAWRKFCHH